MNQTTTEPKMNAMQSMSARSPRRRILALAVLLTACLGWLWAITDAKAAISIDSFTSTMSTSQAGDHPDIETSFRFSSPGEPEAAKNVIINTPEGLFGNPRAVTECTSIDFALQACPVDSQIGLITIRANYEGNPNNLLGTAPLFVVAPQVEEAARFAFIVPQLDIPIVMPIEVRTAGDYGLRFTVSEITQLSPLTAAELTFWGFPGLEEHDPERFPKGTLGAPAGCVGLADASCITTPVRANIPPRPLTVNPSVCSGAALPVTLDVQSHQDPEHLARATAHYPPVEGCSKQTFNPVLQANATTTETDSPSGLDLVLNSPQFLNFAVSPSPIASSVITLPPGFTINPDAADGQSACSNAQASFGSEGPAQCPDNAKIGTFALHSPAIAEPLEGSLYFGEPQPGNQYRLFMIAHGAGINAKLEGSVRPNEATGQLITYFDDLPQVPFDRIDVHLFASDRGMLATPTHCSLYEVNSLFTPWNNILPEQVSTQHFPLESGPHGSPCPPAVRPFDPRLFAGTSTSNAGEFSNFHLQLDRDDGDQYIRDLNFTMPLGLVGSLRGITYCPEASISHAARNPGRIELSAPSCPATSQIGTSNVASGPGTHPFFSVGKIYMAGPFKGAPLSLVVVTPALAGPYDYGTVVVRVAIHVNPLNARVSALSDTVPQIIGGVPLRMRSIRVNLDRPNFVINPTNCGAKAIESQGIGDQGTVANFSSYFQSVNCATMPFRPRMTVRQLGPRGQTKRNRNPRLRFDLRTRPGDANIRSVAVTLPKAFAIDQRHLGNICSKSQLEKERCRGRQPIGSAMVKTPLLDQPLSGPAYAVSGFGKLPRVAFILAGQVTIIPQAESSAVKGGFLRTVVPTVADAQIGHFRLTLLGGNKGYLINTRNLCRSRTITHVQFQGQNGRQRHQIVRVKTPCGKVHKSVRRSSQRATD